MDVFDYFSYAATLLTVNPPHATDFSQLARLANLGIEAGRSFDAGRFDADQRAEIEAGRTDALAAMVASVPNLGTSANGWTVMTDTIGVYGNGYFKRAVVALIGLGANPPEDAVYPLLNVDADGDPITGDNDYVIHFDASCGSVLGGDDVRRRRIPGGQRAEPVRHRRPGCPDVHTDGSLDLYLQHTNPGPDRVSNGLPAPLGPLGVTMRLYAPRREVLDGKWVPPGVRKA